MDERTNEGINERRKEWINGWIWMDKCDLNKFWMRLTNKWMKELMNESEKKKKKEKEEFSQKT